LREEHVPSKLAGLVPVFVLIALFLVGLGIGAAYVLAADRWCPVGTTVPAAPTAPPTELPIRHIAFDLLQAPEQRGAAPRWIVRFFCEARASDLALVFLAYCLVIGAGWLAWATLKLWSAGEQQIAVANVFAEASQRSADTTERSLTRLERPYLLPSAVGGINFSEAPNVRHAVAFAVINFGRAPAVLRTVQGKFRMLAALSKDALNANDLPPEQTDASDQRVSRTLAPSDRHLVELGVPFQVYLEKHAGFARPPLDVPEKLYLSLTIEYLDVVHGTERTGVTLWVYDHSRHGFVSHGGADYNYEQP
jgi:hypothetical protein